MIILYEGLLGGACYVNAFYRISEEVSSSYTGSVLPFLRAFLRSPCGFVSMMDYVMSPQAHAGVDEKHFEIVGPTFSNTVGEFRKLFSSL